MMGSVEMITQDAVMRSAVEIRANAKARYGFDLPWEQAFTAARCASCGNLEILSKEGFCQDCHEAGLAKKEVAA